jgi:hypothetical protein
MKLHILASRTSVAVSAVDAIFLSYAQRRWGSRVLRKRRSQGRVPAQKAGGKTPRSLMYLSRVVVAVALALDAESEDWTNAALEGQCKGLLSAVEATCSVVSVGADCPLEFSVRTALVDGRATAQLFQLMEDCDPIHSILC